MALVKSVLFVDGENLTLRYQAMVDAGRRPVADVLHSRDLYVWNSHFGDGTAGIAGIDTDVLRVNYYTSAVGDDDRVVNVRDQIASLKYRSRMGHIDYYGPCQVLPRVYKKERASRKSRLVDINITIDVMRHAYTDAVDVVYLFSGHGDFLELVADVGRSGKKVVLGAFSSGLDPRLRAAVDRFILLDGLFFEPEQPPGP